MLIAYWLGFRKVENWQAYQVFKVHPPRWPWFAGSLSKWYLLVPLNFHRRSSLQRRWTGGLPPRTRTSRTSPCTPAPWAQGSVSRADVFNPLTELLEHGIIVRFLVIKDKAQLKDWMEVVLQWSSGHSAAVCSGFCLGLGLKLWLFHYYISGSGFILNAIHWENFWCMRRWFIMQRCFR